MHGHVPDLVSLIATLPARGERAALVRLATEDAGASTPWLSYVALGEEVARVAAGLRAAGAQPGAPVALLGHSSAEWVIAALAVIAARGVLVPLDPALEDEELSRALLDASPLFVCCDRSHRARLSRLDGAPAAERFVLLDAPPSSGSQDPLQGAGDEAAGAAEASSSVGSLARRPPPGGPGAGSATRASGAPIPLAQLARTSPLALDDRPRPDEVVLRLYTAGVTGCSRGVPLSHGNLAAQLRALAGVDLVREGDRVLVPLGLHRAYPLLLGLLAPLAAGATVLLGGEGPTSLELLDAIRQGRATVLVGTPRVHDVLLSAIEEHGVAGEPAGKLRQGARRAGEALLGGLRHRLGVRLGRALLARVHSQLTPQLRLLVSSGSPLDPALGWRLEGMGWQVATLYGLTETAGPVTWNLPDEGDLDSAGRPLPDVELRIRPDDEPGPAAEDTSDTSGASGAAERVGEIQLRGPSVAPRPALDGSGGSDPASASFTADGWLRTGDLGRLDERGFLHLEGRRSARLRCEGGQQVWAADVESSLGDEPLIRELALVEIPVGLGALVVADPDEARERLEEREEPVTAAAIEEVVQGVVRELLHDLPPEHRPTTVRVTQEPLPRTVHGELRRHLVLERFEAAGRAEAGPAG